MSEDKRVVEENRGLIREYLESRYPIPLVRMFTRDMDAWAGKEMLDGSINEDGDLDPKVLSEGYEIWRVESREGVEKVIADIFCSVRQEAIGLIYREYGINELTREYIEEFEHGDGYSCWVDMFPSLDGGLDKKALREDIELYAIVATGEDDIVDN